MNHSQESVSVPTPWGVVKNIPSSILGWVACAGIALYLAHSVLTSFDARLSGIETSLKEQTHILREIRDAVRSK